MILVASELVNNALRRGGTYVLRLSAHPGTIEVAVEDPSPQIPRPCASPDVVGGSGGFGWNMVNDLSLTTVVTPTPECGKTVRVFLPR
ncbi:ATP-binding protein [Streptomyces goshikiensis]|uniref:ATP-binding protein n=1 Tax=Streptomyces goshikiensis TaxID=1942 RepID=UPI003711430E